MPGLATDAVFSALAVTCIIFLAASIYGLSRQHPREIYTIWFVFSFFFLLFFALYFFAERAGKEITDILGPSSAEALKGVYNYFTNVTDEVQLVAAFVYISLGPQLLTYILSGLSGSASPPIFVRQIGTIAIWSLIKFAAGLGGILLARPLAQLTLAEEVSKFDFLQGLFTITAAFLLAGAQRTFMERGFEFDLMPGLRVRISGPVFAKVHEFFTRYTQQSIVSSDEKTSEREWKQNLPGLTIYLRGPVALIIYKLLARYKRTT